MIVVRVMTIKDYDDVYELWMNTKGMGMRNLDEVVVELLNFLNAIRQQTLLRVMVIKLLG